MSNTRFISFFLFLATSVGMFAQPSYAPMDGLQFWCGFNDELLPDLGEDTVSVSQNFPGEFAMDRLGVSNGALLFDSPQDYVTINSNFSPNPFTGSSDELSISLWYKVAADSSRAVLMQCYDDQDEANGGWRITWNSDALNSSYIQATYRNGSVDSCSVTADVTNDFYGWHMVTFIVNPEGAYLYIDQQFHSGTPWSTAVSLLPDAFPEPIIVGNHSLNPEPNTTFVGKIDDVAVWNRALTATEVSTMYLGAATIAGCTNSNSCTFNEGVTIDDGTCASFCQGCMDPCACNYDQNASTHLSEICVYDCIVDTVVLRAFLDLDTDGFLDSNEGPLAYRPIIYSGPDAATIYTDSEGIFVLPVRTGDYTFEIIPYGYWDEVIANSATAIQQQLSFPSADTDTLTFAFAPAVSVVPSAEVEFISTYSEAFNCDFGYGAGIVVVNTGNEAISGIISLTCNSELTPGSDSLETIGPDSVSAGYAEWNIATLLPGATGLYTFHTDFNPELTSGYSFAFEIQLGSETVPDLINITDILSEPELYCEDDIPAGMIMADPQGVQPGNYVSPGEMVRYYVYYSNNGPGNIDSVRISVNLNSDQMLLETLDFPYTPDEYVRCLHDDGTIDFYRSAVSIPDTTGGNIDAISYVVFDIQLREDLEHNEVVTVSPIITLNDTVLLPVPFDHRIYRCEAIEDLDFFYSNDLLELLINPDSGSTFAIDLCSSEVNSMIPLNYVWSYDNEPLGDSCSITFETNGPNQVPDIFDLRLIVSNTELGCIDTSEVSIVIPVEEYGNDPNIQVYPNPFSDECTIVFTEDYTQLELYNAQGSLVQTWSSVPRSMVIDRNILDRGVYYLVARSQSRTGTKVLVAH